MSDKEICKQCGGLLDVECIVTFRQHMPHEIRLDPPLGQEKFCPGHPMMADTEGWDKLDTDQKYAVDLFRADQSGYLIARAELFSNLHPELRLSWSFTIDASLRSEVREPEAL